MRSRQWMLGIVVLLVLVSVGAMVILQSGSRAEDQAAPGGDAIPAQINTGALADARADLQGVLEEDEKNAEAHFQLGLVHFNLGEYEQAETHFFRAMELDPERTGAVRHNLGVLAYQVGDMDAAQEQFEAALAADPEDADTHYQLGATLLIQAFPTGAQEPDPQLLAKAEMQFQRALEFASDMPEALVGLANIAMLRNNMEEAIVMLERAVELQPAMREALFALGRAYTVVGRLDEAKTMLQTFLGTDPPPVWAQQADLMLEELDSETGGVEQ